MQMYDKNKKYAVAGGFVVGGNAFVPHAHGDIARAGSPKRLTDPLTVAGQRRQTKPSHEFLHGAPLDDEPNAKLSAGKQAPIHPGMKSQRERGAVADGFDTLRKASDPRCFDNADHKCKALPSAMKR
jgi:hypothetical protein